MLLFDRSISVVSWVQEENMEKSREEVDLAEQTAASQFDMTD